MDTAVWNVKGDVLSADHFSRTSLEELFERSSAYKEGLNRNPRQFIGKYRGYLMLPLFFQPSTRTFMSFQVAAARLGITDLSADIKNFSDQFKGEDPLHTFLVLAGYRPDVMIIRHKKKGGVQEIAKMVAERAGHIPTVNAGDGLGEHPTQMFIDLFTMVENVGGPHKLEGLPVLIGGDLTGRAANSLAIGLAKFGAHIIAVSPPTQRFGNDVKRILADHGVSCEETSLRQGLSDARFIYWTRTQTEQRTKEENRKVAAYDPYDFQLRPEHLSYIRSDAKILHPLPIARFLDKDAETPNPHTEIVPQLDFVKQALYWRQAANGVPVRMACFDHCFNL